MKWFMSRRKCVSLDIICHLTAETPLSTWDDVDFTLFHNVNSSLFLNEQVSKLVSKIIYLFAQIF